MINIIGAKTYHKGTLVIRLPPITVRICLSWRKSFLPSRSLPFTPSRCSSFHDSFMCDTSSKYWQSNQPSLSYNIAEPSLKPNYLISYCVISSTSFIASLLLFLDAYILQQLTMIWRVLLVAVLI